MKVKILRQPDSRARYHCRLFFWTLGKIDAETQLRAFDLSNSHPSWQFDCLVVRQCFTDATRLGSSEKSEDLKFCLRLTLPLTLWWWSGRRKWGGEHPVCSPDGTHFSLIVCGTLNCSGRLPNLRNASKLQSLASKRRSVHFSQGIHLTDIKLC